ncbi:MAG: type III pantothenate kinase [Rhodanobacteraceae bacterium]
MKLLVDLGNSRLKWATLDHRRFAPGGVFAHAGIPLAEVLGTNWAALPKPDAILVASVITPEREADLSHFARERFGVVPEFLSSQRAALGIRNAYATAQRLGVDRFMALAALHAEVPRAQILVSVGTALTLDAIDARGCHLGGLITASPTLVREAVTAATARVVEAPGRLCEFADNTADALYSGSLLAAVALIEHFRRTSAKRLGAEAATILTGGGGEELQSLLPHAERRHDLVLRGLALWAGDAAGEAAQSAARISALERRR